MQLKKFELEFSVDPLFKKASADFDEGGAKGLLLNHLAIDTTGRIVFDSSDDIGDATAEPDATEEGTVPAIQDSGEDRPKTVDLGTPNDKSDVDIDKLRVMFFPNLEKLDEQDICPSLKNFDLGDPSGTLDIPFLKAPEEGQRNDNSPIKGNLGDQTGIFLDGDNVAGFEDDDGILGGFDIGADAGFGEGGDAWAENALLQPQTHAVVSGFDDGGMDHEEENNGEIGAFQPDSDHYAVSMHHKTAPGSQEDILSYFDNALRKNWAGPEHWRIQRLKNMNKPAVPAPSKRKEKEPFEIDFMAPLDPKVAQMIYTPAPSNASISLPKAQWKSKTRNLLPDDKHFNSKQLLQLFTKPKARMGTRRKGVGGQAQGKQDDIRQNDMDKEFWARKENALDAVSPEDQAIQGNYDANFFQDDGLGFANGPPDDDDDFADAREVLLPDDGGQVEGDNGGGAMGEPGESQEGAFGTQIVTQSRRLRPEYVQYARVAKKVDVRRLKEEMWRGIGFEEVTVPVWIPPLLPNSCIDSTFFPPFSKSGAVV